MQISNLIFKNNHKNSFSSLAAMSASVEKNAVLNRSLIDAGGIVPWMFQCNNKEERKERIYNLATFFSLAFVAPILNVPVANRISMKCLKLTSSLKDNNHKAIQISNKYLVNADMTKQGLRELSDNAATSPFELLYKKISGKSINNKIDTAQLLKNCGSDYEILRKRLIKAKNYTLASDLVITGLTLGSLGFLNNHLTKKRTGKIGYSAELEMADAKIIAERGNAYEKNKKKRITAQLIEVAAISAAVPIIINKSLTSANKTKFNDFIKKHASKADYTKGIYMSRPIMLLGIIMNTSGLLLGSRNKTEFKDWSIRSLITTPIFFGGDLLLASVFTNISDKIFKTKLTKESEKKSAFKKIFPDYKSIEEVIKEVKAGKINAKNKKIACGIYWGNLALVASALAYIVPAVCNRMIKQDVQKDVQARLQNIKPEMKLYESKAFNNFLK